MSTKPFLERWLSAPADELPWAALTDLSDEECAGLAKMSDKQLRDIPRHLHARAGELHTPRGRWERLVAELAYRNGDAEPLHELLHGEIFRPPDQPLPYRPSAYRLLALLCDTGAYVEAGVVGRAVLAETDCRDREKIAELVAGLGRPNETWAKALADLIKQPTLHRWDEMLRFVPLEERHVRVKAALFTMLHAGVDPNLLFVIGSKDGLFPDAMGYAEDGLVEPETILRSLDRFVSEQMRATMWGLAAHAYWWRRDRFNVVRCLKEARRLDPFTFEVSADLLCRRGDPELNALLKTLGVIASEA